MSPLQKLRQQLQVTRTRQLIWLETSIDQRDRQLQRLLSELELERSQGVLVGSEALCGITPAKTGEVVRLLGTTQSFAVIDAFSGFNPNAVAQIGGSIAGGGVLILLTPDAECWPDYADPEYQHLGYRDQSIRPEGNFIRWVVNQLSLDKRVVRVSTGSYPRVGPISAKPVSAVWPYASPDQRRTVAELLACWSRPASAQVVTADRGRGKSTSIGLALALQTSFQLQQVAICAPQKSAAAEIFNALEILKPERISTPTFFLPAQLLASLSKSGSGYKLLIIDEAAGIPTPVLQQISGGCPHLLLSTTLHGYEGHGRGFGIRFLTQLEHPLACVRHRQLTTPIRWSMDDSLEPLLNDLFLMGIDVPESQRDSDATIDIQQITPSEMIVSPQVLQQVFALLTAAHYRTSPSDLRVLLDAPGQSVWIARKQHRVIGVLWTVTEQLNEPELVAAVYQGTRRPAGNLLPQSFLYHEAWPEVSRFQFERVIRVAVEDPSRRRGVASRLLEQLEILSRTQGRDLIGTSFACYPDVAQFWNAQGYQVARLGEQVDRVAAAPAIIMLKALNSDAEFWLERQYCQFNDRFGQVGYSLDSFTEEWIQSRLMSGDCSPGDRDNLLLKHFAASHAPLSLIRPALARLNRLLVKSSGDLALIDSALSGESLKGPRLAQLRELISGLYLEL